MEEIQQKYDLKCDKNLNSDFEFALDLLQMFKKAIQENWRNDVNNYGMKRSSSLRQAE